MKPALCHQYSIGAEQEIQGGLTLYAGIFYKKMKHVKDFSSGLSTKYTALTDNMITGSGYARGFEIWPWSVERSVPGLTIPSRNPNVNLLKSTTENPFSLLMMSNTMLWSIPPTISVHALLLTVYGHFLQGFIPHSLSE